MASVPQFAPEPGKKLSLPPLEAGDHLDQPTFHARYEAMPAKVRAELIEGVVYMPSPLKPRHGLIHHCMQTWLGDYKRETSGTEVCVNTTAILGPDSEPQPDSYLIVSPEKKGQMRYNDEGYLVGAPEWVGEIASSSESYDLHSKRRDYERAGVREYVAVAIRQALIFWFISREGKFEPLEAGADGIFRSEAFPGLWLDPAALLRRDDVRLWEVLQKGLASPEHAAWVAELARR